MVVGLLVDLLVGCCFVGWLAGWLAEWLVAGPGPSCPASQGRPTEKHVQERNCLSAEKHAQERSWLAGLLGRLLSGTH